MREKERTREREKERTRDNERGQEKIMREERKVDRKCRDR